MHHETQAATPPGSFSLSSRRLEHGILIELSGEIDIATAAVIEDELRRAEESEELIVLDLGGISFMDSTGLRIVIAGDQRMRERGGSLQLTRVPTRVSELFNLVGIADYLTIIESDGPVPDA